MTAPAKHTTLYFGKREYDADTARLAADALRASGHAVTERHVDGGDYIVETNAPRTAALTAKHSARVSHAAAMRVSNVLAIAVEKAVSL